MQASLAIIGGLFGLLAYFNTLDWRWLLGAIVLLANWPYTLFVLRPTNNRLMETPTEAATAETRRMLEWWALFTLTEVLSALSQLSSFCALRADSFARGAGVLPERARLRSTVRRGYTGPSPPT
jgi:hypothetical protein